MNYSRAIRTVRATKGVSQKELASLANLDPSYVSRIESGERIPTLEVVETISKVLHIPVYLLMLLASEQKDLKGVPEKETKEIANNLLDVLLSAKKHE